jgi:4-hydroxybenzoyl-CoA reductase subunit alpha
MKEYSVVGKRLPRVDGAVKATGAAQYTDDMTLPGMLYGKILRSPHPHARILDVDTARAQHLPGVKAVITGKDTLGVKYGLWRLYPNLLDEYPLAMDRVRYIGDEVAAVAAIDEDIAQEALELIRVEYEELPAVFDPLEAMEDGAPQVHDGVEHNISVTRHVAFGDVEQGFQESDYVREDRFHTQVVLHAHMEPHAALASFDASGKLTLWSSTQSPYIVQVLLAMTLGMREGDIRVIKPHVGGGFGNKIELFPLEFCSALLSKRTGRPVKMTYTRAEEFIATRRRHAIIIELKTGVKKDGTLVARQCRNILDGGAYNSLGPTATFLSGFFHTLPYKFPHYKYDGYHVYTNKAPAGAMRGFGETQPYFAGETQLDRIAEELGIDPLEIRLKNACGPGYEVGRVAKVSSCGFTECLEQAAQAAGWKDRRGRMGPGKGIGMGSYAFISGGSFNWFRTPLAFSNALIKAGEDGSVSLYTGSSDIGQGSDTVMCQIVAEELGIRMEDVKITVADTETTPMDIGTWGSRVTLMAGNAVLAAARDLKGQVLEAAARGLKTEPGELEVREGQIYVRGAPERKMAFSEAVVEAVKASGGKPLIGRGSYHPEGKGIVSPAFAFGVQVAEVEVDRETGQVRVLKTTTAHDCGMPINPMAVEGQLEGSVHMGLGQTLYEQEVTEKGRVANPSFLDYQMATAPDMPQIEMIEVRTDEPEGPFGAKEAGEGLVGPTVPAIANAVYDAVGVWIKELPITPEKILRALREKGGAG